jgi:hypothetical protein
MDPKVRAKGTLQVKPCAPVQIDVLGQGCGKLNHQPMQREAPECEPYIEAKGIDRRPGILKKAVYVGVKAMSIGFGEEADSQVRVRMGTSHRQRPQHLSQGCDDRKRLSSSEVVLLHEDLVPDGLSQLG